MADIVLVPSVRAAVVSGPSGSAATEIPSLIQAQSSNTLAPAIGQAQLIIADADGHWYNRLRPNDIVTLTFSSRQYPDASRAPRPSWTGLVDTVTRVHDPQSPDGAATRVTASTFWKLFMVTAVPLYRFANGQYPGPSIPLQTMFDTALGDVFTNTGIRIVTQYDQGAFNAMTPPLQFPHDYISPQNQSWASFLLSQVVVAGIEVYFDERGVLVVRSPQYAAGSVASIPDEEIYSLETAISDAGLVTNTLVSYTVKPESAYGEEAPAGGAENRNFGALPAVLQDGAGAPLPRLGQRFMSLTVPWISNPADAGRYAAMVRVLGLAGADQADVTAVLHGDLAIGTTVTLPGQKKSYYIVEAQNSFLFGDRAETRLTLRYGMGPGETWDSTGLGSYGQIHLQERQDTSGNDDTTQPAALPLLGADPSILLTDPTLSRDDLYRIMTVPPGCAFSAEAGYIWTESQDYGIDPGFALAVWRAETQLGTDGSAGSRGYNPGNLGPGNTYANWEAGIDAWYRFIKTLVTAGKTTVAAVAATYIPDTPADPNQMENWVQAVTQYMRSYRGQHRVAAVPNALPAAGGGGPTTPGDGTPPQGYPFAGAVLYPVTQAFGSPSTVEPAATYQGVFYPHFHRGIDLGCPSGTPLLATMNGTVTIDSDPHGYGTYVLLTNNPFQVLYGHTQGYAAGISDGMRVTAGATIAVSDNTGNSTGPHLHYEVRQDGVFVDPVPYLG